MATDTVSAIRSSTATTEPPLGENIRRLPSDHPPGRGSTSAGVYPNPSLPRRTPSTSPGGFAVSDPYNDVPFSRTVSNTQDSDRHGIAPVSEIAETYSSRTRTLDFTYPLTTSSSSSVGLPSGAVTIEMSSATTHENESEGGLGAAEVGTV